MPITEFEFRGFVESENFIKVHRKDFSTLTVGCKVMHVNSVTVDEKTTVTFHKGGTIDNVFLQDNESMKKKREKRDPTWEFSPFYIVAVGIGLSYFLSMKKIKELWYKPKIDLEKMAKGMRTLTRSLSSTDLVGTSYKKDMSDTEEILKYILNKIKILREENETIKKEISELKNAVNLDKH